MDFHKIKEDLISNLRECVGLVDKTILALQDVPEADDAFLYSSTEPGYIRVDLPYDLKVYYKGYRKLMGHNWKLYHSQKFSDGDMGFYFRHHEITDITLQIVLSVNADGATCKRIKTGEKVVPIYETVCD